MSPTLLSSASPSVPRILGRIAPCLLSGTRMRTCTRTYNKRQRMRIVLFIGSPINTEHGELIAVGKKLKKCNVAVDVVIRDMRHVHAPEVVDQSGRGVGRRLGIAGGIVVVVDESRAGSA